MSTPASGTAPAEPAASTATPASSATPVATATPAEPPKAVTPSPAPAEAAKPTPAAKPAAAKPAAAKPAAPKPEPAKVEPAKPATAPSVNPVDAARALRHQRARKLARGLVGWVVMPTLVAAVYLGFVAHDQYESVVSLALRGPDAAADAAMLRDYVASRAILGELDADHKLSAHFQKRGDAFSRLSPTAGREAFFKYYAGKVDASYDTRAGVLSVRFRAFSGSTAQIYLSRIVQACRRLLRETGARTAAAPLEAAQGTLDQAKTELLNVSRALGELEAGVPKTGAAPEQLGELEAKRTEKKLAEQAFESARTALESVRAARNKQTQLSVVAPPSQPDQATHPRRLYGILTTFLAALAIFGTGRLLVAAAREHSSF